MDINEALARMEIQDVLWRYARGVDRYDYDLLETVYHPDGTDQHSSFNGLGRDFARHHIDRSAGKAEVGQIHITNLNIQMRGDDARVESYFLSFRSHRDDDGQAKFGIAAGRYLDHFQRRDGSWRIVARRVVMDWTRDHVEGGPWPAVDGRPSQGVPRWLGDASYDFFA